MRFYADFCDRFFGPCTHRILNSNHEIYLTFDDGPSETTTPKVLELLAKHKALATFFVIADRAQKLPSIVKAAITQGHGIGNHSLDHKYHPFFESEKKLASWIMQSHQIITSITDAPLVGFRSPVGIRTPRLHRALEKLSYPLIHWNQRFYDTQKSLTKTNIDRYLIRLQPGDIILLHDVQSKMHEASFLENLDYFLGELSKKNLMCQVLKPCKA